MPSKTPGAVVEAVAQDVDLGVVPCDELAVHPDRFSLLHGSSLRPDQEGAIIADATGAWRGQSAAITASVISAVPTWRSPSAPVQIGGPQSRGEGDLDGRSRSAAAPSPSPSPWRSIIAAERKVASGLAAPVPAMSGAEPWTGSKTPGPAVAEAGGGQHPERARDHRGLVGEDVAEHVLGDDHVELGRIGDELHRRVVDEQVVERDVRVFAGEAARRPRARAARSRGRWPCRPR